MINLPNILDVTAITAATVNQPAKGLKKSRSVPCLPPPDRHVGIPASPF